MKKSFLIIILFKSLLTIVSADSTLHSFCKIDDANEPQHLLTCFDHTNADLFQLPISKVDFQKAKQQLLQNGVRFYNESKFAILAMGSINSPILSPEEMPQECFVKSAFKIEEIHNNLFGAIQTIEYLATILKEAGVCNLEIFPTDNTGYNLNIKNHTDLIHHFLCIANYESALGRENLGEGGRGVWGIGPVHDLYKGTNGTNGGICDDLNPIQRDSGDIEIEKSAPYFDDKSLLIANAKCAFRLYTTRKGFKDWGTTDVNWGSNPKCTEKKKANIGFTNTKYFSSELGTCP